MEEFCIIGMLALMLAFPAAVYADDGKSTGDTVFGKPDGTDVQGNPNDKNAQGNRPKDAQGNPPKDFYGNKTGTENK